MLRRDHVQWITAACNELPLLLPPRACNELQLLLRHRAVRRNTHAGHDIPCYLTAAAASSCMQWITATAAPSCGQKKHTRWRSNMLRSDHVQWITAACNELPLLLPPRACNELQLLLRHRAVRRNTHAGHDIPCYLTAAAASSCMQWITATAAPSCGQKKHTRWRSNMLRSDHVQWITAACKELPLLLRPRACNEWQLLLRHRAVRKNTHAGEVRLCFEAITCNELPLHAMNDSCCCVLVHAMNYSYCCAIVRSEETHTLATTYPATLPLLLRPRACNELQLLLRHRAVRKNTHAGEVICFEAITCNELPLHAMYYSCCCAIVRSEDTHTLATTYPATNYIDLRIT